jgi:hypothetical protein
MVTTSQESLHPLCPDCGRPNEPTSQICPFCLHDFAVPAASSEPEAIAPDLIVPAPKEAPTGWSSLALTVLLGLALFVLIVATFIFANT